MKIKLLICMMLFFVQIMESLPKQSLSIYTTLDDYIPDEYDIESLKLYPLIKLKNLNDVRLTRLLQTTDANTTN